MQFNFERTKTGLQSLGFEEVRRGKETFQTYYVRPGLRRELTEWVHIMFQGKALEFPIPYVAISPIRKGALVKGLVEMRYLEEIDKNWPYDETKPKILNDQVSLLWEQMLINKIPSKLEDLNRESAESLLQNTAGAREAVKGYFSKVDRQLKETTNVVAWYQAEPASRRKSRAARLSCAPGICNLSHGHWLYEIAIFIMLLWSNEVEGKEYDYHDIDPLQRLDREFVFRKELIVDEIILRMGLHSECT